MNLILFGPPGVGKGTQALELARHYNLDHISTGDMLRAAIKAETALGKVAKGYVESGGLVPDEVIIGLVGEVLHASRHKGKGFLLDGFPRTVEQARALDELFAKQGIEDVRIVMLEAPETELVERMLKRGRDTGRVDDTEETIKHRLNVYQQQTQPVKTHYDSVRSVELINGLGSVEEVTRRIRELLQRK